MSRKIRLPSKDSGQGSEHSSVKDSDVSFHMVGSVSTYKKKEKVSCLTAFLNSQRQYFEAVEQQDETQYLKAQNQKRTEEMLQRAKEELYKRKENCSGENTSNNKEMVTDTKQHHQSNALEVLYNMGWLQNQSDNDLASSNKTGDTRNVAFKEVVPLKREETDEYFSCTKLTKIKGRRKNRTKALITLEERPRLEAAAYQKGEHPRSYHKSENAPIQQTNVCLHSSPPVITCWQQKAGADLFPDISRQTLAIYGAGANEDVLLKRAIEESLKTYETENCFSGLSKASCMDRIHRNTCMEIMQLPVLEPVKDESQDDAERMGQDGSVSLAAQNCLTLVGQIQDHISSSSKHGDWEMGPSQATSKVNEATEKWGTRGKNQKRSEQLESPSSNKGCNITIAATGHHRSQHRVGMDAYNLNGDFKCSDENEYKENIWVPLENDELSAGMQNENQCPIKKCNEVRENAIPDGNTNFRDGKAVHYVPKASDSRTQEQDEWKLKKGKTAKKNCVHDQNLRDHVHCPQPNRRESDTETYVLEANDSRMQGKVNGNQKKDQTEKQKGDHDENLRELVHGPQRNRRVSKTQSHIPNVSDSITQGEVNWIQKRSEIENQKGDCVQNLWAFVSDNQEEVYWNPEKNVVKSQKVHSSNNYVSLGEGMKKSFKEFQHEECFDIGNLNLLDRKPVYCSDEEWRTKDNELDRNERLFNSRIGNKVQRHGPVSQDAVIYKKEETSLGRVVGVEMPEKGMNDHFASKKSEGSGEYVHTNYDGKVHIRLGVHGDEPELSYDENLNSEVPVELPNLSSVQNSPEILQASASHIYDTHQHQIPHQFVDSPTCASQLHSVDRSLFPLMNPMTGVFPSTGISPTKMDISTQPHAQHIPNQTVQHGIQLLPNTDIQKLFEAFVQEQQQRMMYMKYLFQMAVMNPTGLPNAKSDSELQAQQSNLTAMMAGPMNLPRGPPAHHNDLLLQSYNTSLNPSVTPLLNSSVLAINQNVAPRNVPLQSEASTLNREASTLQMPDQYMNVSSVGGMSVDDLSVTLNHRNQTNCPSMDMNSTVSTALNDSMLHGNQANNPVLMPSPSSSGHDHMMYSNYQFTQTQRPAVGSMSNMMQHVAPDVYNQPFGSRPSNLDTSSRMIIGKGRGRLMKLGEKTML